MAGTGFTTQQAKLEDVSLMRQLLTMNPPDEPSCGADGEGANPARGITQRKSTKTAARNRTLRAFGALSTQDFGHFVRGSRWTPTLCRHEILNP